MQTQLLLIISILAANASALHAATDKKAVPAKAGQIATTEGESKTATQPSTDQKLMTIGKIDGESTEAMSIVTVRFGQEVNLSAPEIEDHGTFIQLKFPNSITANSGEFFEGNSPYVRKIAVFQTSDRETAVRLFVTEEASKIKTVSEAEVLGNRLVFTIDHQALRKALSAADPTPVAAATAIPASEAEQSKAEAAQPTLASEKPNRIENINTPASRIASENQTPTVESSKNLDSKAKLVAILSAITFSIFLLVTKGKNLVRSRLKGDLSQEPTIRSLANFSLAPKHHLSLIEVAGERILLSVSNGGVSLLTHLPNHQGAAVSRDALAFAQSHSLAPNQVHPTVNMRAPRLPQGKNLAAEGSSKPSPALPKVRQPIDRTPLVESESLASDSEPDLDGVQLKLSSAAKEKRTAQTPASAPKALDDVTKMIREKLKNLPPI